MGNNPDPEHPAPRPDSVVGEEPEIQFPPARQVRKSGSSFTRGILSLGGGSASAQLLGILAMPLIARLFLPEAFGIAALFLSFSSILGSVAALRYEFAIVLPKEDEGAANLLLLCFLNTVLAASATALLVTVFGVRLLVGFNAPELIPYRWLFPAGVFLFGISSALKYWNTRNRYFFRQGTARVANVAVKDSALIGGGLAGFTSGGYMIVARLFGELVPPLLFGAALIRHDLTFIIRNCAWKRIWKWAKRYRKFPLFDTWTALLQAFSVKLPVLVLMRYFGPREAGLFSQSLLLLWLPTNLIGASIFQVSFQRLADRHASGKGVAEIVSNLYRQLFALGFFPLALLVVIGPDVFRAALGQNWAEAGVYARMLVPWIFVNFLYSPLSSVLYILEKQHANLIFNSILFISRLGALLLGVHLWGDIRPVVFAYGLINLGIYLSVTLYMLKCARVSLSKITVHGLRIILISAPFLFMISLAKWGLRFSSWGLLATGLLFCCGYLAIIVFSDRQLRAVLPRSFC